MSSRGFWKLHVTFLRTVTRGAENGVKRHALIVYRFGSDSCDCPRSFQVSRKKRLCATADGMVYPILAYREHFRPVLLRRNVITVLND